MGSRNDGGKEVLVAGIGLGNSQLTVEMEIVRDKRLSFPHAHSSNRQRYFQKTRGKIDNHRRVWYREQVAYRELAGAYREMPAPQKSD